MLRRLLRRFGADNRGNMAIMFGFLVIPIIGAAGLSIDYGRATYTRTSLQNAIDATALMLSRDIKKKPDMSAGDIQTRGKQYFDSLFNMRFGRDPTVTSTYTAPSAANKNEAKVVVVATAQVDATLMRILGSGSIRVASDSEIVWGNNRLEVALVLDNSGSMDSAGKMTELKKAVSTLLDSLYDAATKLDDVRVAVIPYAGTVNVGTSNVNATWLNWSLWTTQQRSCNIWGQCTTPARSTWNGCVTDRTQPNDASDIAPTTTATQFPTYQGKSGDEFQCPDATVFPLLDILSTNAWIKKEDLTKSASQVKSVIGKAVAGMASRGATNGAIGTAWGWHALTKSEPLTQARDPMPDTDKVIIMLTDGRNTVTRTDGDGTDRNKNGPPPCPNCDSRYKETCRLAKQSNIIIYVIGVFTDGEKVPEDLLKECATDEQKYKLVSDAKELDAVFSAIAQNLVTLRINK